MNFNSDDILARLLAGENASDIASEMTKALNEAISKQKEAAEEAKHKEEERAKAAEAIKREQKIQDFQDVTSNMIKVLAKWYPSAFNEESVDAEKDARDLAEVIVSACDEADRGFSNILKMTELLESPIGSKHEDPKVQELKEDKDKVDEALRKWLESL